MKIVLTESELKTIVTQFILDSRSNYKGTALPFINASDISIKFTSKHSANVIIVNQNNKPE